MSIPRQFRDSLARRLADQIHVRTCHYNHTDGCGYFYVKWAQPERWSELDREDRTRAYRQASQLIERLGPRTVGDYLTVRAAIEGLP